jgi:hypothetical protein
MLSTTKRLTLGAVAALATAAVIGTLLALRGAATRTLARWSEV